MDEQWGYVPSGVGKTETVLQLAELLYGGRQYLTTINMSEFQEKHTVSRLIGSPPGYVGYGEGGVLTEAIRQKPYSVVLLDEVEKAHPDVLNLFYQSFDKGEMADGEGRLDRMNLALPDLMVAQTHTRASLFSFSRQMQGSREPLVSLLEGLLDGENMNVMLRGVYLTSSLQRGQMDDIFTQSAARQYRLGNNPLASWPLVDTAPYFTRSLFPQALLAEPNLATESRAS